MAFNWQTFKTRSLSALIFVAVMGVGLFWNYWSFFILFSIIHFGCWLEYQKLIGQIDKDYAAINPVHKYGVIIAGLCIMLFFCCNIFSIGNIKLNAIGWYMGLIALFILPISELLFARHVQLKNIRYSALGLLYISLSWGLMMDIKCADKGEGFLNTGIAIPVFIIFSIWINDTMAYIVGSLIGKRPFSSISPKKTWEGTIGGALLAIVVMSFVGKYFGISLLNAAAIATIAAVTGTLGDLLESKLKRMAGIKDSGNILPGHGGFLDRFDSLLIATPFVWLYIKLVMH